MKRITPEMVKAAYAKTGFDPVRNYFLKRDANDNVCLCGLLVVAVVSEKVHWLAIEELGEEFDEVIDLLAAALDLDREYVAKFAEGFDGWQDSDGPGYLDGRAAAAAVFTNQQES